MPTRVLGVQIANGYSPEAQVFARLLAHASPEALEPHVLYQQWDGDPPSAKRFQEASSAPVQTLDFGWRSVSAHRSFPAKAGARLRFLASLPQALRLARHINPDVIYSCQQLWDCQAATYLARKLNKPQVIHLHYIIGPWLHRPILERLRTCAHVITVSDFIRGEALKHGVRPERVTTIRNTIMPFPVPESGTRGTVRRNLGLSMDAVLLGIIGRLDPDKGQSDTLRAFALAVDQSPNIHLLVVGDETPWHPGYTAALKALAADLGLTGRAHFLGRRSDVPHLLAALDIFVHPSRREPFGLAVAEASAAGLPVVAYAEGGLPEIVQEGVTGLLTPPENIPALASSLTQLAGNQDYARTLGQAGRSRMTSEFGPAPAGKAFAELMGRFQSLPVTGKAHGTAQVSL